MQPALLFDIDGTLLHAKGLGRPAFATAFEIAYGIPANFDAVSFVGATDTGVIRAMAKDIGTYSDAEREERFYIELTKHLEPVLAKGPIHIYPGIPEALARLCDEGYLLGTVTGNIRGTAWAKLIHSGLSKYFSFGAYSTDDVDRNNIARIAAARARTLGAEPITLIGDTPKDIEAAHALGLPALAVASGWIEPDILHAAGAEAVLPSLASPDLLSTLRTFAAQ